MQPELQEGDVVLALTWRRLWRLRPGSLLLFRQPGIGLIVKKLDHVLPDGRLFVVGTVPASVDSYEFGPVAPDQVVGVVIRVFR
jgi:type IV secretory pathway protease TraF